MDTHIYDVRSQCLARRCIQPRRQADRDRGFDQRIRFWNATDTQPIGEPINGSSEVRSLVFSPDGHTLAIACRDGKARFWDVGRSQWISDRFDQVREVYSIAYSHDGKVLATGGEDGQLIFWDAALGRQLSVVRVHTE